MVRTCKCSGGCCGSQADEVSRRGFLTVIGAGAATAAVGTQAWPMAPAAFLARGTCQLEEGPHAGRAADRLSLRR